MERERLKVTWEEHSSHTNELLRELFDSKRFSDVTLICNDQQEIKAHKFILSSCSSRFKSIIDSSFRSNDPYIACGIIDDNIIDNVPYMNLKETNMQELESILQFIYLGEAEVYQENIEEFLKVAKILNIKGLEDDSNEEVESCIEESKKDVELIEDEIKREVDNDIENQDKSNSPKKPKKSKKPKTNKVSQFIKRENDFQWSCSVCEKVLTTKSGLQFHIQSDHHGIKNPCPKCDYQASTTSNLNRHIKAKHEGVKFPCNDCDYKASYKSDLLNHSKSKHVQYSCQDCDYKGSNLKQHIKQMHEDPLCIIKKR